MKKLILSVLLLAFANTSFALEAYVGVYGGSISSSNNTYSVETSPAGASIGLKQNLSDTPFFVLLEAAGTENALSPTAAIGVNIGKFSLSAGSSFDNEERARYAFGGVYSDGYSTDEFTSNFIEVSGYDFFVRYSEYDVNYNFVGTDKTNPNAASATKSLSSDNSAVQIGYRYTF